MAEAQPNKNTIQWIDWWVRNETLGKDQNESLIEKPASRGLPPPITGWKIYDTIGDGNCMIHALLIDISQTFRKLNDDVKRVVAQKFRTGAFANLLKQYYGENYKATVYDSVLHKTVTLPLEEILLNKRYYLNQEFLIPICQHFGFNVTIYATNRPGDSSGPARNTKIVFDFEPEPDLIENEKSIVMHNADSFHFEAMSSQIGIFFLDYDEIAKLKVRMTVQMQVTQTQTHCLYTVGDIFVDNQERPENPDAKIWTTIEVLYPSSRSQIINCDRLRIKDNVENKLLDVPIQFFSPGAAPGNPGNPGMFKYLEFLKYQSRQRESSSARPSPFSPSFGQSTGILGRAGNLGVYPDIGDDNELVLGTTLKSPGQKQEDPTREALNEMKKDAVSKLKKLQVVQDFFGSSIPLDCEKLKKSKLKESKLKESTLEKNILRKLQEFESKNLLIKLYKGIFQGNAANDKEQEGKMAMDVESAENNKTELYKFFTSSPEMVDLCKLANLDLVLNNVSRFYEVARQSKYSVLFSDEDFEKGKFIQPPLSGQVWKKLLEELQKSAKLTRPNVAKLLPYLEGSNALLAYRKVASSEEEPRGPLPSLSGFKSSTKWLREILTTYNLPGYPSQFAVDFYSGDINNKFVIDLPEEQVKEGINGKEFVKSMITNRSTPMTFKLANEFAGNELTQKLVNSPDGDYYETQKIPFLDENAAVFISREITEEVENFERLNKNPEEFDQMPLSRVSVPLFIIFSCLKRIKKSETELKKMWTENQTQTANYEDFLKGLGDEIYKRDKKGEFIFNAFHTSNIFLCNGKMFTIGYGSDPLYDAEQASAENGDTKIKYLKDVEGAIKNITGLTDLQILGTGFIYSPDMLDIEDEELNYRIVDAGILKKSNIIRLNKILATVKQVRANTMVVNDDDAEKKIENKIVTVEQLSCQTRCIYSRLATRYTQSLPFASQLMNCSSFVELGFPDRIDCSKFFAGYSDPNSCISKTFGKVVPIGQIFDVYFGPRSTIGDLKTQVGYQSDVPSLVSKFGEYLKNIAPVLKPWFMNNPKAGVPSDSSTAKDSSIAMEVGNKEGAGAEEKEGAVEVAGEGEGEGEGAVMKEGGALKLKKRRKQKRPKNLTARK